MFCTIDIFHHFVFRKLSLISLPSSVEVSFSNEMYRQIDGISMGNPLRPTIANIFVGFQEQRLFAKTSWPNCNLRYVDYTFYVFNIKLGGGVSVVFCYEVLLGKWRAMALYRSSVLCYKYNVLLLLHLCTINARSRECILDGIRFFPDGIKLIW